ncbi:START-like domain-containing protein [Aquirufa ecclesiirivi]|uniref:START-like domain-containing protein n=1 Tax=Aquirufa ecclesiirivi TaxID=2715124 RepID=UPI0022A82DF1|nr:START-like domain-containing protein [Aquirufa ecclesiirivi]
MPNPLIDKNMPANNFEFEYEVKASPKVLYPYLSTASGLQQWFADKVTVPNASTFHFYWDDENHPAVLVQSKLNKFVRFEFLNPKDETSKGFIELKLEVSELSNTTYLKVTDRASTFKSDDDAAELWDYLCDKLKEIVGS